MEGARQRTAATKRKRTQNALVDAACGLVAERGWHDTRVEDVAQAAGVSVATAYNHFSSKQALLTYCYGQLAEGLVREAMQTRRFFNTDISGAVSSYVRTVANVARANRNLTVALLTDSTEAQKVVARLSEPLRELIEEGQQSGKFDNRLDAGLTASYHTGALLARVLLYPDETPVNTAALVSSDLWAVLRGHLLRMAAPERD